MKVALLSYHYANSKRRAGFHALAKALTRLGHEVLFVTTSFSTLSTLRGDKRSVELRPNKVNTILDAGDLGSAFVFRPLLHPAQLPRWIPLSAQSALSGRYGKNLPAVCAAFIESADMVFFESTGALLFFDLVRRLNPRALSVYRVSDDLSVIPVSDVIREHEKSILGRFDVISVPSRILLRSRFEGQRNACFHPHGLDSEVLQAAMNEVVVDQARQGLGSRSVVAVGSTLFDASAVSTAAEELPDFEFHLVGDLAGYRFSAPNIVLHGELEFKRALAFSAAARVTWAPYKRVAGSEYLAETSNKIAQYRFFRKPIVVPHHVREVAPSVDLFGYDGSHPQSIKDAFLMAAEYLPLEGGLQPPDWVEVANQIINDARANRQKVCQ